MALVPASPAQRKVPGLYTVHKPVGPSSFSIVQGFTAELQSEGHVPRLRVCHGGTLDPFAEGLLLLLVGPATHLFEHLHAAPKRYLATVQWGTETDNGDLQGKPLHHGDASQLTADVLTAALTPFLGWQEQVPPSTSAKKIHGEPAYRRVHRGETVSLPPSRVFLHAARFTAHDLPRASELELVCRGGYYVRALVRDLGRTLGCGAHVGALRRPAIGPWEDPGPKTRLQVTGGHLLPWLPRRAVTRKDWSALKQHQALSRGELLPPIAPVPDTFPLTDDTVCAVFQDELVGLLRPEHALLAPRHLFRPTL